MNLLHQVFTALLFLNFLITFTNNTNDPTHFTADVSINCGSTGTFAARNGREWVGDVIKPKFSSLLQVTGSSTASSVKKKLISADPIPHKTARVSRSHFSYSFQVSPGQKILRLHFNPSSYKGFKGLNDLFTVEAGAFTLLGNFSASLTANALGVSSFSKEFFLYIQENEQLNITFSPETSNSWDTYTFINGIEIISVPTGLSFFQGGDFGVQVVGQNSLVYVDHHTALELIHRLHTKHGSVRSTGDFDGTFPMWALRKADKVKNVTWKIPVDVGFKYMIRLHLSDMGLKIAGTGEVVFKVLINEIPAHTNVDLVKERDDKNKIPMYRDYMVMMRGQRKEGIRDLSITMHSYDDLIDGQGFLAGFEVFKLSNPDNSLASPNPLPPAKGSTSMTILILFSVFSHGNVISTLAITIGSLVCVILHMCQEYCESNSTKEENKPSARAERLCRRFSLAEIQLATRNFGDGNFIGKGGFGLVYKGLIDGGQTTVAVKRLKQFSMQGKHEFLMEIETLTELRHFNLVSLIGYCNENREMILVYDYIAGGTLSDHLYKLQRENNNSSSLTWKQRLNICIGAGRGLDYLHTGHGVIHRDVKTPNILLDENFVAKVSDFGLAKHEDRCKLLLQSYISTSVKGTKGYLDPHYLNTGKLTRKTDTYAFGVVLFEILCGRPAVDLSVAEDEHILIIWARDKINRGEVDQIVASSLREEISPASLKTFVGIAERCLCDDPKDRPTMSQVMQQLELALDQHETASASDFIRSSSSDSLVRTAQFPLASGNTPYLTSPPEKHINSQAVNGVMPSLRRAKTRKPLQLRLWDAISNRFKPSKKKDTISGIGSNTVKAPDSTITVKAPVSTGTRTGITVEFPYEELASATSDFSNAKKIGQGGFGTVYYAELRGEVRLIGYCVEGSLFLVFEYIENGNSSEHLRGPGKEPLSWSNRVQIALDSARGLEYIHEHTVPVYIHHDIKPSNILVDKNFHGKVADFGLAELTEVGSSSLQNGPLWPVGTFGFIAPQHAQYGDVSPKVSLTFAARFAKKQAEKDRPRTPMVSFILPEPGRDYSDPPFESEKLKQVVETEAKEKKRTRKYKQESFGKEDSKRSKLDEVHDDRYYVTVPIHYVYHKSVLNNEDPLGAYHYCQGLCPSPDGMTLEKLDDKTFNENYAHHMSKALPYLSHSFHRARGGYNDPTLITRAKNAEQKLRMAEAEVERATRKLEDMKSIHEKEIKAVREQMNVIENREAETIEKSYNQGHSEGYGVGYVDGERLFPHSRKGLDLVQRVRDITRLTTLHSEDAEDKAVDVSMFYIEYLVRQFEAWKKDGKDAADFDLNVQMSQCPQNPDLTRTTEQERMERITAEDLVIFIEEEAAKAYAAREASHFDQQVELESPDEPGLKEKVVLTEEKEIEKLVVDSTLATKKSRMASSSKSMLIQAEPSSIRDAQKNLHRRV